MVGRVGDQSGAISFKVTVDADGKVTLDQKLAIVHSPNTGPDQATGLSAADLVKLVATITDRDGDPDSATLNLGNAISFRMTPPASVPRPFPRTACRWMKPTCSATPPPTSVARSSRPMAPMAPAAPPMPWT